MKLTGKIGGEVEHERRNLRRLQTRRVMPLIGQLLDKWDELPNDEKEVDELKSVAEVIIKIDRAMEGI